MNKTEYLEYCNQMYAKGNPILPDEVYDRLVENTELENQVGYIDSSGEQRFKHPFPMYSLQKVFVGEDKEPDWDINETRIMTAKLDGAAVSITYMDGELQQALTRGDGKAGLDITDKMRFIVPRYINIKGLAQITGEVVAPKTIPNARNYASGALNLKDIEEFKSRDLTFMAYAVQPTITDSWVADEISIRFRD